MIQTKIPKGITYPGSKLSFSKANDLQSSTFSSDQALLTGKNTNGLPSRSMNHNKNANNKNDSSGSSQNGQPDAIKSSLNCEVLL